MVSVNNSVRTSSNLLSWPLAGMLDFERRECDLRYTIIISLESSKGRGTGGDKWGT